MLVLTLKLQGPELVIHQPDHVLDAMGDWCKTHHWQVTEVLKTQGEGYMYKIEYCVLEYPIYFNYAMGDRYNKHYHWLEPRGRG